jgi:hypothetical protein
MRYSRVFLLVCLGAAGAAGCSSGASSAGQGGLISDAGPDVGSGIPVADGGGIVPADAAADAPTDAADAQSPALDAGAAAHQGFAILAGGVRATSSAHVLVTTTGQAPGGNTSMHSAAHTVVGGVVGATQKP